MIKDNSSSERNISKNSERNISSSDRKMSLTETLFETLERRAKLPEEDIYSPRDNVITAEHILKQERLFYNSLLESFIEKRKRGQDISPDEYQIFRLYGEKLRKAEEDLVSTKKRATETSVMLSTKFDAAQVISIVKQIPSMLAKDLDSIQADILLDITEHIQDCFEREIERCRDGTPLVKDPETKNYLPTEKILRLLLDAVLSHKFLNKLRQFEVAKLNNTIIERLEHTINSISVPIREKEKDSLADSEQRVSVAEIEGLIESLVVSES